MAAPVSKVLSSANKDRTVFPPGKADTGIYGRWSMSEINLEQQRAPVVEALIRAGAEVRQEYLDWIRAEKLFWPASKPRIEGLLYEALIRSPGRI
jgi:hypothetical protein